MASVDIVSFVATAHATGFFSLGLDDGNTLNLRIACPPNANALSTLSAPPAPDADTAKAADCLRHRIRDRLGICYGPPVVVFQLLAALHGHAGPEFTPPTPGPAHSSR